MRKCTFAVQETLDERFSQLRQAVDVEIARARRDAVAELARAMARMRAASNESEWTAAVLESGRAVSSGPLSDSGALELLAALAALTVPCPGPIAGDAAARRFAKVKIAEMRLYQAPAVESGRAARDLYGSLQPHIDAARKAFAERFLQNGNRSADYLHSELVRVLAKNDATLLGPDYPGPMA
ncbi:MAG TPA: hypothetical protein VKX39_05755 [Bryobacteraceae bacterium]|nr:hypothetical protein [Bryobacteraceae bacterium]